MKDLPQYLWYDESPSQSGAIETTKCALTRVLLGEPMRKGVGDVVDAPTLCRQTKEEFLPQ